MNTRVAISVEVPAIRSVLPAMLNTSRSPVKMSLRAVKKLSSTRSMRLRASQAGLYGKRVRGTALQTGGALQRHYKVDENGGDAEPTTPGCPSSRA